MVEPFSYCDLASNMKYEKIKFGESAKSLNTIANLSKVYFSKEFLFFRINTDLIILLTFNIFFWIPIMSFVK